MSFADSLRATQELATLPHVATRVLAMLENDELDLREITNAIESDAPLTLKIIRVANSPVFAVRSSVTSVHQAILTLGLNRVTNIVLGVSVFTKFMMLANKRSPQLMQKFWLHSASTGMVAKALARKLKKNFKELEFLGGLLHDVGKMTMIQYNADMYDKVGMLVESGDKRDREAEREIFGIDHCEAGAIIASMWKLPQELQMVIAKHHEPEQLEQGRELISLIRVADILCEIWGVGAGEGIEKVRLADEQSWQILCSLNPGLDSLDLEAFTFELEQELSNASNFMESAGS